MDEIRPLTSTSGIRTSNALIFAPPNYEDGIAEKSIYVTFPRSSTISVLPPRFSATSLEKFSSKQLQKEKADVKKESLKALALIRRYKMFYRLEKIDLRILCGLFGVLEISVGYTVVILKMFHFIHHQRTDHPPKDPSQPNVRYSNAIHVLQFAAYAILAFSGMVLVFGAGICRKESKTACLSHFYFVIADMTFIMICLAVVGTNGYKTGHHVYPVQIDVIIHVASINLICMAMYMSYGLYGAIAFFDLPGSNDNGIETIRSERMGQVLDDDVRLGLLEFHPEYPHPHRRMSVEISIHTNF